MITSTALNRWARGGDRVIWKQPRIIPEKPDFRVYEPTFEQFTIEVEGKLVTCTDDEICKGPHEYASFRCDADTDPAGAIKFLVGILDRILGDDVGWKAIKAIPGPMTIYELNELVDRDGRLYRHACLVVELNELRELVAPGYERKKARRRDAENGL